MVDLPPMGLTLHAAEDVLGAIAAGQLESSPAMIDQMLACLDQISAWVDDFETDQTQPPRAGEEARTMADVLRNQIAASATVSPARTTLAAAATDLPDWVHRLIGSQRGQVAQIGRNNKRRCSQCPMSRSRVVSSMATIRWNLMRRVPQATCASYVEPRESLATTGRSLIRSPVIYDCKAISVLRTRPSLQRRFPSRAGPGAFRRDPVSAWQVHANRLTAAMTLGASGRRYCTSKLKSFVQPQRAAMITRAASVLPARVTANALRYAIDGDAIGRSGSSEPARRRLPQSNPALLLSRHRRSVALTSALAQWWDVEAQTHQRRIANRAVAQVDFFVWMNRKSTHCWIWLANLSL